MEDDIFAQLANLVNNKPTYNSGNQESPFDSELDSLFGGFSDASGTMSAGAFESNSEMFEYDDVVVPDIKPKKVVSTRKSVVVIDDDFSTLDLMKIYLMRDYDYKSFDDPKSAIFYLNTNIPDLIFIDCYLNTMNSKRVVEIIRSYKELKNIPIIYLAEPSEAVAIAHKLPTGVMTTLNRPVRRGDLQAILDEYLPKVSEDSSANGDNSRTQLNDSLVSKLAFK